MTSTETTKVTRASCGEFGRVSQNRAGCRWCWDLAKEGKDQHFLEQESTDRVALPLAGGERRE